MCQLRRDVGLQLSEGRPASSALDLRVVVDDLSSPAVLDLLDLHLREMYAWSPPCRVHALPAEGLRAPSVTVFSAWDGDVLAGIGALKQLDVARGELKSMRAAPAYRGRGVGALLLEYLVREAEQRGYRWLGLETGQAEAFSPAKRLYTRAGFVVCAPFDGYTDDGYSLCMSADLPLVRG